MKTFFVMLALVSIQMCVLAGIEADIPSTNQVVLKSGSWTPGPEQTQKALMSVQSFLNHPDTTNGWQKAEIKRILANMKKYRIQFIGVIRDGRKVIRCNFFPAPHDGEDDFKYWKEQEVEVRDGGFWFWRVYYDPNTEKCLEFMSNGYG